jgi:hypothetical protein
MHGCGVSAEEQPQVPILLRWAHEGDARRMAPFSHGAELGDLEQHSTAQEGAQTKHKQTDKESNRHGRNRNIAIKCYDLSTN